MLPFADMLNSGNPDDDEARPLPSQRSARSPRASSRANPEASAAATIVDRALATVEDWIETGDAAAPVMLPPAPTLQHIPLRPPPLGLGNLRSAADEDEEEGEEYLGDMPFGAEGQHKHLQIRNLDTGEVIPLKEADAKLHHSLTVLTPRSAWRSTTSPRQTPRKWGLGLMLSPRRSSSAQASAPKRSSLLSPRRGGLLSPRATPRVSKSPAAHAAAEGAALAKKATEADHAGSEYEAISYYRQSVRMIVMALTLHSKGGKTGVDPRALHFYAKAYKSRAEFLEKALEDQLPPEAFEDPESWFATKMGDLQAELNALEETSKAMEMEEEEASIAAQEAALDEELVNLELAQLGQLLEELDEEEAALTAREASEEAAAETAVASRRRFRARGATSSNAATKEGEYEDEEPVEESAAEPDEALEEKALETKDSPISSASISALGKSALVPALSIPTLGGSGPVPALSIPTLSGSGATTARSSAAAALASARTARSAGALTARSGLKPQTENVGMLTPRGGKDTDERAERSRAAKEAPPSSRRARDASESSQSL